MLTTRKHFEAPTLGVSHTCRSLLHSRYQCVLSLRDGLISDIGQVAGGTIRPATDDRLQIILPLRGRLAVRGARASYWLEPGGLALERRGTCEARSRQEGAHSASFIMNWDPAWMPGVRDLPTGPLPLRRPVFERLAALALSLDQPSGEDAAEVLARIVGLLRAEGLPLADVDAADLREEVPEDFIRLSHALDRSFASLSQGPALVDLQQQLSWPRQRITQTLRAFSERYGFYRHDGSWRSVLRNWRLGLGVELMSAEGATTEAVAALLGYHSPESIFRAFANAGLPSPWEARQRLLRAPA